MEFDDVVGYGVEGRPTFWSVRTRRVNRTGRCTLRSRRPIAQPSTRSSPRPSPRAPRSSTSRGCGRSTTRATTERSCATPTATTSKPCATGPHDVALGGARRMRSLVGCVRVPPGSRAAHRRRVRSAASTGVNAVRRDRPCARRSRPRPHRPRRPHRRAHDDGAGVRGSVAPITAEVAARMPHSWRPGCPVPLDQLRLLTLEYWGYDGVEHRGELVIHADHADAMLGVVPHALRRTVPDRAHGARRRLRRRRLRFDASQQHRRFNCRSVVGRPGSWSGARVRPCHRREPARQPVRARAAHQRSTLTRYLDRSLSVPGLIREGDPIVGAFAAAGWQWGGTWSAPDYQHFSANRALKRRVA